MSRDRPEPESTYVHGATVSSIVPFIDPSVPFVQIFGHLPNTYLQWWRTDVPLNSSGARIAARVRCLAYDLQLATAEFLLSAHELEGHGLTLVQSQKRLPDTLRLEDIRDESLDSVLIQNGAVLYVELPHAVETAMVRSYRPGHIARVSGT